MQAMKDVKKSLSSAPGPTAADMERVLRAVQQMSEAIQCLPARGSVLREAIREFEFWFQVASSAVDGTDLKPDLTTCRSILDVVVEHLVISEEHISRACQTLAVIEKWCALRTPDLAQMEDG
jgi:hypothetical protein